jgi:hypothetical protein
VAGIAELDRQVFGERSYHPFVVRQLMEVAGPLMLVCVQGTGLVGYCWCCCP